jgi:hypothetical protein
MIFMMQVSFLDVSYTIALALAVAAVKPVVRRITSWWGDWKSVIPGEHRETRNPGAITESHG